MLTSPITDEQIRELRRREAEYLDAHDATKDYDEFFKHRMAYYHASVALGIRRARKGGSKAKSRAYCAELLNERAAKVSP